jgi:hypothetical protein
MPIDFSVYEVLAFLLATCRRAPRGLHPPSRGQAYENGLDSFRCRLLWHHFDAAVNRAFDPAKIGHCMRFGKSFATTAGASIALSAGCLLGHTEPSGPVAPTTLQECISVSEALYARAEQLSKAKKIPLPRDVARVSFNLEEFCRDLDFVKARVSIEWLETCLNNFSKDYKLGFCTRQRDYFCATYPESDGCRGT